MPLVTEPLERTAIDRAPRVRRIAEFSSIVGLGLVTLALFVVIAEWLPLDLDEAYYVIAGTIVSAGKVPYRDFFFPQTPLSAYVFGAWSSAFGVGFVNSRYLGAILAAATGLLITVVVRRRVGIGSAVIALGYYVLSIQVVLWMPRLKTYGMSSLIAMSALVCVTSSRIRWGRALAAGLLSGLAISARLLFFPIPAVVLIGILLRADLSRSQRRTYCGLAFLGSCLGMLPLLATAVSAPSAFLFDNISYHALRDGNEALIDNFGQKFHVLRSQINLRGASRREAVQFLALVPVSIATLFGRREGERHLKVFPLAALSLLVVSFLPSPVYRQYLVTVVPPAILAAALLGGLESRKRLGAAAVFLVPYGYACQGALASIPGSASTPGPAVVDAVGHRLGELTQAGDLVAGLRAHLLFAADRPIEPCSCNSFARGEWELLTPQQIQEYHLCTANDIVADIRARRVKAFVARPNEDLGLAAELQQSGWSQHDASIATIWIAPELTASVDVVR